MCFSGVTRYWTSWGWGKNLWISGDLFKSYPQIYPLLGKNGEMVAFGGVMRWVNLSGCDRPGVICEIWTTLSEVFNDGTRHERPPKLQNDSVIGLWIFSDCSSVKATWCNPGPCFDCLDRYWFMSVSQRRHFISISIPLFGWQHCVNPVTICTENPLALFA